MDFTNLRQRRQELLDHLEREGYTPGYVRRVKENIGWILRREEGNRWASYADVYHDRVSGSGSKSYRKVNKTAFAAIRDFDLDGALPVRGIMSPLFERGAYCQLVPEFKELIDLYREDARRRGLKETTVKGGVSNTSSFLLAMQQRGARELTQIGEEDVASFFAGADGRAPKSHSYQKQITAVLKAGFEWKAEERRALLAILPSRGPSRKNVQFLRPEEAEAVRACLENADSGLSLRGASPVCWLGCLGEGWWVGGPGPEFGVAVLG